MCLDVACAEILVCTSHFCLLLNRVFLPMTTKVD